MKSLTTGGGTYVTGDTLADAVMSYSLELARLHRVDDVVIPFRTAHGEVGHARFTVGWMTNVESVSYGHPRPELTDPTVNADLHARQEALRPHGDSQMTSLDFRDAEGFDEY